VIEGVLFEKKKLSTFLLREMADKNIDDSVSQIQIRLVTKQQQ